MMITSAIFATTLAATGVLAQRPSTVSICDYYSNALLNASNATTQYTLLTLLVNTAVIGNYTTPNKLAVPGILAKDAKYNGTTVNLLPYFSGDLLSSNRGGTKGVGINFLDGGGATPLTKNKPAEGTDSNQYKLLTHLYSYFGLLLGCSDVSKSGFPSYSGDTSMYDVHKFMALDAYQVQYFIHQVGLSAASFGVADADIEYVGHALQGFFGVKCAPETKIIPDAGKELQSICIADDCPESPNATCKAYGTVTEPKSFQSTGTGSGSTGGAMPGPTGTGVATQLYTSFLTLVMMVIGVVKLLA